MNQEVYKGIVKALTDWQSESRNYTFETRWAIYPQKSPIINGELLFRFYIKIGGFFNKSSNGDLMQIPLTYVSDIFQTSILTESDPDNPAADGLRLKSFLKNFTCTAYEGVHNELDKSKDVITSDPRYW